MKVYISGPMSGDYYIDQWGEVQLCDPDANEQRERDMYEDDFYDDDEEIKPGNDPKRS